MSSQRRGGRGGHWKADQGYPKHPQPEKSEINEDSPVIKAFRSYQFEMDSRNDRFERIMKLNRDITIESKRLIFLLQRIVGSDDAKSLLDEYEEKIKELHSKKFSALARELKGQDIYQFLRAFTGGLQEYIEAVTFHNYLSSQQLVGPVLIQSELVFGADTPDLQHKDDNTSAQTVQSTAEKMTDVATSDSDRPLSDKQRDRPVKVSVQGSSPDEMSKSTETQEMPRSGQPVSVCVPIPPSEYMLGVADFTGELMRMAINSVGAGDLDTPRVIANMMRDIHTAFTSFSNTPREMRRKTNVLRQSLEKVERACYALHVRGSEMPKHMLTDVFSSTPTSITMEESEEVYG